MSYILKFTTPANPANPANPLLLKFSNVEEEDGFIVIVDEISLFEISTSLLSVRIDYAALVPERSITTTITLGGMFHLIADIFPPEIEIRINLDSPYDPQLRVECSCLSIHVAQSIPEIKLTVAQESDYKWTLFQPVIPETVVSFFGYCDEVFNKSTTHAVISTFSIPEEYSSFDPIHAAFGETICISGDSRTVVIACAKWRVDAETILPKVFVWKMNEVDEWFLHCVIPATNVYSINYDGSLCLIDTKVYRLFPIPPFYNVYSSTITDGHASHGFTYLVRSTVTWKIDVFKIIGKTMVLQNTIQNRAITKRDYYKSYISDDGKRIIGLSHNTFAGTISRNLIIDTYEYNGTEYKLVNTLSPMFSTGQVLSNNSYGGGPWDVPVTASTSETADLSSDGEQLIVDGIAVYRWVETSWVAWGKIPSVDEKLNVAVALSDTNKLLSTVYGYAEWTWQRPRPCGIGNVYLYNDVNIIIPYVKITLWVECSCEEVIGSSSIVAPELALYIWGNIAVGNLQMLSTCGEAVITVSVAAHLVEDKDQKYELRNLMTSSKTEFGYSVNMNASGRIMVIGHSTGILTYDYVSPDWVKRVFELSATNPVVCLNDSGSVLMVGEADSNKVSVFVWGDDQWTLNQVLNGDSNGSFGCSISTSGNVLSVGANTYDGKGKVYIYDWSNDSWVFRNSISGNVVNERFGISVAMAINGTMLCIAAKMDDLFETPANIYTYDWIDFNWELRSRFEVEENSQLNYINKYRKSRCDLFPLRTNMCLFNAAYAYSKDMCERQYSGHFGLPEGSSSHWMRCREAGYLDGWTGLYEPTGENIGHGIVNRHISGELLIEVFKDSYTHAANMVSLLVPNNPDITIEEQIAQVKAHFAYLIENADYSRLDQYQEIGIGTYCDNGLYRTTHDFGFRIENDEVQYGVYNRGEQDFKHTISLSLTEDGTLLTVGSTEWTNKYSHSGSVQTLTSFGDTWISIISDAKEILTQMPTTLYYGSTINVVQPIAIQSPNEQFNERFGQSVSLNNTGNVMVVGANYSNDKEGRVYIFTRYPTTYKVSGIIRQGNDGVPVVTRLISVDNGEVVESLISGNDGLFEIKNLTTNKDSVLLFHNRLQGSKNDVVQRTKPVYYLEED